MNGSAIAFQDVISKLNKVIANYHEGLVRIDREFHAPKKALNADQERNQEVRKSNWKLAFAKEWEIDEVMKTEKKLQSMRKAKHIVKAIINTRNAIRVLKAQKGDEIEAEEEAVG